MPKRILSSFFVLISTYLFVNILHILILKFAGEALGYSAQATFTKVELAPREYQYWSTGRVLALYALPLLLFGATGFFILFSLKIKGIENSFLRFVLFWLMVWTILLGVSQTVVAPFGMLSPESNPMFQDFAVVATWFKIPAIVMSVLGAAALGVCILVGFLAGNYFFSCGYSAKEMRNSEDRRFWLISMFYIPVIFAMPLSIICSWPQISFTHLIMSACSVFVGFGLNLYSELRQTRTIKIKSDITNRYSFDFLLLSVILIAGIRFFIRH